MKLRQTLLFLMLFPILSAIAAGQEEELPRVEVFGGYSLLRSEGENFHGWKAAVGFPVKRWFAIAVDTDGHYFSETAESGTLKQNEYTLTAGPHFSLPNKSKFVPFTYAMAGAVWESKRHGGEKETSSGFAFETGGGVDWELSKHFSLRLIDVGASITRIDGHTTTKPKFTTGLVIKFGKK